MSSAHTCRAAAGACDRTETCDGTSAGCPADALQPGTHTCRAASGECDQAELCSGSATGCPADLYLPNGTSCLSGAGSCQGGKCLLNPDAGVPDAGPDLGPQFRDAACQIWRHMGLAAYPLSAWWSLMDENEFFRHASLRVCGHLDVAEATALH